MPSFQDSLAVTLAIIVALTITAFAVLAGTGALDARPAGQGAVPDPACAEWTDGCVVCARRPEGLACSTPGIACTRKPVQCLRR
jgi:hypothetical protein